VVFVLKTSGRNLSLYFVFIFFRGGGKVGEDFFFSKSRMEVFGLYEKVKVSLMSRRTAVPIEGLVGIEVACEILNK